MAIVERYCRVVDFDVGLTTVGYRLYLDDAEAVARTTAGVAPYGGEPGGYGVFLSYDDALVNRIQWDQGTTPNAFAGEDLPSLVELTGTGGSLPTPPPSAVTDVSSTYVVVAQNLGVFAAVCNVPAGLAWAAREVGSPPAAKFTVTDAELSAVPEASFNELIDLTIWRCLEQATLLADDEALRNVGVYGDADKAREALERKLGRVWKYVSLRYGLATGTLSAGTIDLRYAATDDDLFPGGV